MKMKDLVVGMRLAPTGFPSGSQNRLRSSTEHILGALGELLDAFRDHFWSDFIPVPFRSFSRSQFALALALRLFLLIRQRCASMLKIDLEKNGELKKLPSNMRLNIYPDDRLWINIQT